MKSIQANITGHNHIVERNKDLISTLDNLITDS